MIFNSEQKTALKSIFQDAGFLYSDAGKFHLTANRKVNSINTFLKTINAPMCFDPHPSLLSLAYLYTQKKFPFPEFDKVVKEFSDEHKPEKLILNKVETSVEDEAQAEDPTDYIRTLVPTVNILKGSKDRLVLLDPHKENRPVFDIDPEIFMAMTERKMETMITDPDVKKVMTCFDPYTLKSLFIRESKTGSITTWHVNYYVAPRWRFLDAPPKLEGFIKTLIDHLFPNEDEKEFVLDWLHYAIVNRNDTVLCLIGARGTGKGILLKDIMGVLIGEDYREIVNQEILTDKFNAAFKNRRYIFFDEVNVSGDRELNKFKAFCNTTIALEEKGQDSETIDNFTSLGLSSNDKKDFRAEPQERRFSVPEITERALLDLMTEDEVESFCKRIIEPGNLEIASFGNFLIQRKPKNSSRKPLKGKYFFNLCKLSMPEWKTYIIEYLINEGEIGVSVLNSTLVKKFKKIHGEHSPFATKRGSIETFLLDYYHDGICRIGKVVDSWDTHRARDTFAILPDEEFMLKFGKRYQSGNELDAL
jgi:hypothetical protein